MGQDPGRHGTKGGPMLDPQALAHAARDAATRIEDIGQRRHEDRAAARVSMGPTDGPSAAVQKLRGELRQLETEWERCRGEFIKKYRGVADRLEAEHAS